MCKCKLVNTFSGSVSYYNFAECLQILGDILRSLDFQRLLYEQSVLLKGVHKYAKVNNIDTKYYKGYHKLFSDNLEELLKGSNKNIYDLFSRLKSKSYGLKYNITLDTNNYIDISNIDKYVIDLLVKHKDIKVVLKSLVDNLNIISKCNQIILFYSNIENFDNYIREEVQYNKGIGAEIRRKELELQKLKNKLY